MSIVAGFCVYLWKRPVMQYIDRDIGVSGVSPGVSAGVTPGVSPGCAEVCPNGDAFGEAETTSCDGIENRTVKTNKTDEIKTAISSGAIKI